MSEGRTVYMLHVHRPKARFGYGVKTRGQVVEAKTVLVHARSGVRSHIRGDVSEWSRQSRSRMCKALASQVWDGDKKRVFITLTFAQEGKVDGRAELRRFRMRWERRWGPVHAIWWREFQKRGVVHYHLLAELPPAQHILLRKSRWVSEAWKGCGGGFAKVEEWHGGGKDLWKYAAKEVFSPAKSYQHELPMVRDSNGVPSSVTVPDVATGELVQEPVLVSGLGRWWGVWGCCDRWEWRELTREAYCDLRRRMRAWGCEMRVLRGREVCSWWAIAPPDLARGLT